ncbi:conserved hypothetical protein [Gammaproteobacteria bacterium]
MADWRKVAKAFVLMDGHISEKEVNVLRKTILEDGKVSKSELQFLTEIKEEAKSTVKALDALITECEKSM